VSDPPRNPTGDPDAESIEELGDEVIIAQETGAHAPQRRANVTTDHPTVVISEHPPAKPAAAAAAYGAKRDRSEQTVVIRDRKRLEKMRREIERRRQPKTSRSTIYLVGIAALASLATGTLIAALVDASDAPAPAPEPQMSAPVPLPVEEPAPSAVPPGTIDLDALPDTAERRQP